jgi:hypothetical protein
MDINYEKLHIGGDNWNERSLYLIKETLSVWDNDHKIIICHPNIVFNDTEINHHHPDFTTIEWNHTNKIIDYNRINSYTSNDTNPIKSWKYIQKRLGHEVYNNMDIDRHLAVVETDLDDNYLVRCIYKVNKSGVYLAINPAFEEYRPKNLFEKSSRYNGKYIDLSDYFGEKKLKKKM